MKNDQVFSGIGINKALSATASLWGLLLTNTILTIDLAMKSIIQFLFTSFTSFTDGKLASKSRNNKLGIGDDI